MTRKTTLILVAAVLLIVAASAYWHWSPVLSYETIVKAAETRDKAKLMQYVDLDAMKAQLKLQLIERNSRLAEALQQKQKQGILLSNDEVQSLRGRDEIEREVEKHLNADYLISLLGSGIQVEVDGRRVVGYKRLSSNLYELPILQINAKSSTGPTLHTIAVLSMHRRGFAHWVLTDFRAAADAQQR